MGEILELMILVENVYMLIISKRVKDYVTVVRITLVIF